MVGAINLIVFRMEHTTQEGIMEHVHTPVPVFAERRGDASTIIAGWACADEHCPAMLGPTYFPSSGDNDELAYSLRRPPQKARYVLDRSKAPLASVAFV